MPSGAQSSARVREVGQEHFANPATFLREIAAGCEPVIVRGLADRWPVIEAARVSPAAMREYLARFATDMRAEAFVADAAIAGKYDYDGQLEGFNFERVGTDLIGGLDRILASAAALESPSVYVGSLEASLFLPGFAEDNRLAAVLPTVGPRIWIGNASRVACHNDTYDNIACVVAGRRTFTLYPPDAIANLYIGPIDHTLSGRPSSLAAGAAADDPRFPRLAAAAARAQVAELGPGDALYLPKLWWHQVEATEPVNVLVNYWWDAFSTGPDAPNTAMMLAMIAIAERPEGERAAWRALFDHYVFRAQGHPLAHVAEEKRGILARIGGQGGSYGRIRAMVMQMLRGG